MADTIVTNSPGTNDSGAAGWVVALIILVVVIVGGFLWYRNYGFPGAGTTNINLTVPNPTIPTPTTDTTQKP